MTYISSSMRAATILLISAFFAMLLASCQSAQLNLPGQGQLANNPSVANSLLPANGEVIGSGDVRLALLLPLSAPGNAGKVASELANAAKLAMRDFGQNTIQLVIKNTAGQEIVAREAASEAVLEKSSLILGPLFSGNVGAVTSAALRANIPVVAFSSDPKTARRGVYLMSFSPQADIKRTLNYAISQGRTSFVALLPNGEYGTLAEAAMNETLTASNARLVSVAKYDQTDQAIDEAARAVAVSAEQASVIYIPDGGKVPSAIVAALGRAGINTQSKMKLGSGQWESANYADSNLQGAYFAGRDKRQFSSFSTRYKAAFGNTPSSTAGLAYDAVSMAAGLVRRYGNGAFSFARIENRNGFSGVNGIFRFTSNGLPDRGLVIYQIQGGRAQVVSEAPSTFGSGS